MSEHDFRTLMKDLFGKELSPGQIKELVRSTLKGKQIGKFERTYKKVDTYYEFEEV